MNLGVLFHLVYFQEHAKILKTSQEKPIPITPFSPNPNLIISENLELQTGGKDS